ncbi:MAG: DUF4416 family protein [Bacteriovoracaceae bacterium]
MGTLKTPTSALLFSSILYRTDLIKFTDVVKLFTDNWGTNNLIFKHDFFPMLDYYYPEMGGDKKDYARIFIVSLDLVDRMQLKAAKLIAQQLEEKHFIGKNRTVNFDIGILTLENLQLATSKNFTHRVYLGDGVYSDLTLIFQGEAFDKLPWSYPDYAHPEIIAFFNYLRAILSTKIKV